MPQPLHGLHDKYVGVLFQKHISWDANQQAVHVRSGFLRPVILHRPLAPIENCLAGHSAVSGLGQLRRNALGGVATAYSKRLRHEPGHYVGDVAFETARVTVRL